MSQSRRFVLLLAASLLLVGTAEAGTYRLVSDGPNSTLTLTSVAGARTIVAAPTTCVGIVSPSWPTGTFSASTCADAVTAVTAAGRRAQLHVSAAGATGSFDARNVLRFRPTLTIRVVADDGSFDCNATTASSGPDFGAVMSPTLPLPPPKYEGRLALVSSVSTGGFAVTASCSAGTARSLDAELASITAGVLDASYAP